MDLWTVAAEERSKNDRNEFFTCRALLAYNEVCSRPIELANSHQRIRSRRDRVLSSSIYCSPACIDRHPASQPGGPISRNACRGSGLTSVRLELRAVAVWKPDEIELRQSHVGRHHDRPAGVRRVRPPVDDVRRSVAVCTPKYYSMASACQRHVTRLPTNCHQSNGEHAKGTKVVPTDGHTRSDTDSSAVYTRWLAS